MNLAFPIRAIKMYSKELFIPVVNIGSHTVASQTLANREDCCANHKFKQIEWNFKKLVTNQTLLPDSPKHQQMVISGYMFQRMLDKIG